MTRPDGGRNDLHRQRVVAEGLAERLRTCQIELARDRAIDKLYGLQPFAAQRRRVEVKRNSAGVNSLERIGRNAINQHIRSVERRRKDRMRKMKLVIRRGIAHHLIRRGCSTTYR